MLLKKWEIGGIKIEISICDITKDDSEAIVNAANSSLKHGGGVAWAIVKEGGYEIQRESDEYVKKHGPVATGEVAVTSAGKLNAKYVIHAVGPIWKGGNNNEDSLLFNAVYNTLKKANELEVKSVSMPAISTGIYGFPKERAAEIFGRAISKFVKDFKNTSIKRIRICHIEEGSAKIFAENMKL
ncbi:Appr-1-p processing enzyme family protein [Aciduliprofundum boonei T469]|nr:Appr-1-p processing enzyme family protein [Aciduliprofundum boonei T469]